MKPRLSLGALAFVAAHAACGARSTLEGGAAASAETGGAPAGIELPTAGGGGDDGSGGGGEIGGGPVAAPQCLCPNLPGYAACELPLMCCPTHASCENPATYNCTGSQAFYCDR